MAENPRRVAQTRNKFQFTKRERDSEGDKRSAGRGRGRIKRQRRFRGYEMSRSSRATGWLGNDCGLRQDKNHSRRDGMATLLAAGHCATGQAASAIVLAVHRRFRWCGSPRAGAIWFRVSVRRAHGAVATGHPMRLPSGSPPGRPEHHDCQKTHPRAQFSSRSDRRMVQPFHLVELEYYRRLRCSRQRLLVIPQPFAYHFGYSRNH
jgi:hypothetical protein